VAFDELTTDRSDASGTGYWNPATGAYDRDLLVAALGHDAALPRVLGPDEWVSDAAGRRVGPGAGDNAAAALGVGADVGDVVVSIGTSGTVFAVSAQRTIDPTGTVAGFADAGGHFLPLVATLNAARVLDVTHGSSLSITTSRRARLAAATGAGGCACCPTSRGSARPTCRMRPRS
jgi:xylulokinase